MRALAKFLGRLLVILAAIAVGLWLFGPYEDAPLTPSADMTPGADLDAHFAAVEAAFDDITPGVEKRIVWADAPGQRTDWVVVYVHGFSATSEEIRPVPDRVAQGLSANLIYTRLQGHGRSGDALATGTVQGWVNDFAEAMAAARAAGDRIVVMATSTGGTLVTALAQDAKIMDGTEGLILVSPNYALNNPMAPLLSWPASRYWLPVLAGQQRSFEPSNDGHGTYWTTEYPSTAVFPMVALIDAVADMDHGAHNIPALFWYARADAVVRADASDAVAGAWGAASTVVNPVLGDGDDTFSHVIAGDILSPGQTESAVDGMLDWVRGLGN
ncbi:MAG: alpha/beta fold hydrolase [Pseudomonadota bacterium]